MRGFDSSSASLCGVTLRLEAGQALDPADLPGAFGVRGVVQVPRELQVHPELRLHAEQPLRWASSTCVSPSGRRNSSSSISPGCVGGR